MDSHKHTGGAGLPGQQALDAILPNIASKPGDQGATTTQIEPITRTAMIRDQIGRRAMN